MTFSICSLTLGISQETNIGVQREITVGVGMSLVGIKDNRVSALKYRAWTPSYMIGFKKRDARTKQEFLLSFSMDGKNDTDRLLNLRFIKPSFSYSFEKKVNDFWVGGVFNHNTLLTFPSSNTGHFNNNPISYTIANSFGPKISWLKGIQVEGADRYLIESSVETSLLNYVIRPSYAHPYPEKFLRSGTFTPTKEGMALPLLRSGKVFSVGKYQTFKVVLGLSYFISDRIKVGMNFNFDYARTADINTSSISSKDILFQLSYQY